jgi:sulfite exporter TauE/SafE
VERSVLLAFVLGLASTLHCLGMCGSIVGALTLSLSPEIRARRTGLLLYALAYSAGRVGTYAFAGALAGGAGWGVMQALGPAAGHAIMQGLAAVLMVGIGLYLAGWFPQFARLEGLGTPLWRRLEPVGRRLLPVRSLSRAVFFGALWGWLPCGLVYSLLAWSTAAGGAGLGSLYMLAFGLGTLPAVVGAGVLTGHVTRLLARGQLRQAVGLLVTLAAVLSLAAGNLSSRHSGAHLEHGGHENHQSL